MLLFPKHNNTLLLTAIAVLCCCFSASAAAESPFQPRHLNNNQDDAIDFTWISNYSIRFHSCHTAMEFRPEGGGGSADGNDESPTELLQLVQFRLCPTNDRTTTCRKNCRHGADYVCLLYTSPSPRDS